MDWSGIRKSLIVTPRSGCYKIIVDRRCEIFSRNNAKSKSCGNYTVRIQQEKFTVTIKLLKTSKTLIASCSSDLQYNIAIAEEPRIASLSVTANNYNNGIVLLQSIQTTHYTVTFI